MEGVESRAHQPVPLVVMAPKSPALGCFRGHKSPAGGPASQSPEGSTLPRDRPLHCRHVALAELCPWVMKYVHLRCTLVVQTLLLGVGNWHLVKLLGGQGRAGSHCHRS